jgi:hypothetical protein
LGLYRGEFGKSGGLFPQQDGRHGQDDSKGSGDENTDRLYPPEFVFLSTGLRAFDTGRLGTAITGRPLNSSIRLVVPSLRRGGKRGGEVQAGQQNCGQSYPQKSSEHGEILLQWVQDNGASSERRVDPRAVGEFLECRDLVALGEKIARLELLKSSDSETCLKNSNTAALPRRSPEKGTCFAVPMTGRQSISSVM